LAVIVSYDGTTYTVPNSGETGWGDQVTNLLVDLAGSAVTLTTPQTLTNKTLTQPYVRSLGGTGALTLNVGNTAARPGTPVQGDVRFNTDTGLEVFNGSTWETLSGASTPYVKKAGDTMSGALVVSSGGIAVTGNSSITGTLTGLTGLTVASGGISVTGNSTVTGTLSGLTGLTVSSGGIAVTGNSTVTGTLGGLTGLTVASGGLTVSAGGFSVTGNSTVTGTLTATGTSTFGSGSTAYVTIAGGGTNPTLSTNSGNLSLTPNGGYTVNAGGYAETSQSVTAVASTTITVTSGTVVYLSQATNITTLTISSAPTSGTSVALTIIRLHDATTNTYTITWPASVKWSAATAPTLTQTANAVDIITMFTRDGGTTWFATAITDMR
jgi:hypothetical protein